MEVEFECTEADYSTVPIDVFAKKCAPSAWKEFFDTQEVQKDLETTAPVITREFISRRNYPGMEPAMPNVFKALEMTAGPTQVRVVILGQDPTPQAGKATGLAFSVADPRTVPSVMNVLLEVALEGFKVDVNQGCLEKWATQGVLLLNTALTVERGKAGCHMGLWNAFTELLIRYISEKALPTVWILWGREAQQFEGLIDQTRHYVLKGGHPLCMPGNPNTFFGGNYFRCANKFLLKKNRGEIDWSLVAGENTLNACPPHQGLVLRDRGVGFSYKRNHN